MLPELQDSSDSVPKSGWAQALINAYRTFSLIVFNTLVLIIIINIILGFYYSIRLAIVDNERALREEELGGDPNNPLVRYGYDTLSLAYPGWSESELENLLNELWGREFECAPYIHFREAITDGTYLHVHEAGFRWNREAPPWPPIDEATTIFVFGGSTTFGYGLPDYQTIPAFMQEALEATSDEQDVYIYNFGQGAYYSSIEMILFQTLLQEAYVPDIVIFIDGLNDLANLEPLGWRERNCDAADTSSSLDKFFRNLPMMRFLSSLQTRFVPNETPNQADDLVSNRNEIQIANIERWMNNRRIIRGIAAEYNIKTVFVWQPIPTFNYYLSQHPFREAGIRINSAGYEAMASRQTEWEQWEDFLYLADIQQNREEILYVDAVHYTAAFSQEIAYLIIEFMQDKNLIHFSLP